jgi:hypothetical protein
MCDVDCPSRTAISFHRPKRARSTTPQHERAQSHSPPVSNQHAAQLPRFVVLTVRSRLIVWTRNIPFQRAPRRDTFACRTSTGSALADSHNDGSASMHASPTKPADGSQIRGRRIAPPAPYMFGRHRRATPRAPYAASRPQDRGRQSPPTSWPDQHCWPGPKLEVHTAHAAHAAAAHGHGRLVVGKLSDRGFGRDE